MPIFCIARRICQIQYLSGAGAQGSADGRSPGMGPGPPCGGSCLAGKKRASFGRQVRDGTVAMSLSSTLGEQLRNPSGNGGLIVGWLMRLFNHVPNRAAVRSEEH